ncbi:Brefeldin A-inhibited guanine nucleotide-exchange protein 1 (Brefeldin A-inhibited GEP 1) (ADP-ribosylation factor guanine nucleotide-exchange factor 1) (p200 ARF guanine nucleotide exchange factor) (p200 ARF-GEP1) [Durusdinium trenchii]|uniref:SEC7 domain-containing protein n=1 Tax=Durusdinium trenchii TaxID=1381693 RepID=A0ABP0SJG7_9DINO
MEAFLEPAFKRMFKDSNRKFAELREATQEALQHLANSNNKDESDNAAEVSSCPAVYLRPLVLGCRTGQSKVVVSALDALQKLMSYSFLDGDRSARDAGFKTDNAETTVMDVVIQTICSCEDTDGKTMSPDDAVQLQVIKALLTAVTSSGCGVHETSLLNSVRACYHIHLYSRNSVNKGTAKTALTQMMNVVFQKMEVADAKIERILAEAAKAGNGEQEASDAVSPAHAKNTMATNGDEALAAAEQTTAPPPPSSPPPPPPSPPTAALGDGMYSSVADNLELGRLVTSFRPAAVETGASGRDSGAGTEPKGIQGSAVEKITVSTPKMLRKVAAPFRSMQHKDAYLLFRALCKLSMKNQNLVDGAGGDEPHIPDPIALRSKVLSLDLVLSILEGSGPAFRRSKDFVYAIKTYLSSSLIKNCVSTNTQVVSLSLRIFVALQARFARYLKAEIELVMSQILLPVLESANSPHEHKLLVLEVFLQISRDVETLVSIFLSYDCDWDSIDLYSRIVKVLLRLASEPHIMSSSALSHDDNQKNAMHSMSLRSIVSVIDSLAESCSNDPLDASTQDTLATATAAVAAGRADNQKANPQDIEDDGESNISLSVTSQQPVSPTTAQAGLDDDQASETEQVLSRSVSSQNFTGSNGDEGSVSSSTRLRGREGTASSATAANNGASAHNLRKLKVDSFQQKQKYMRDLENAASKFLIKPRKGIEYLVANGYIDNTPEDVALALLEFKDHFSKTLIGEYLGDDKEVNIQTLHCYVDQFSFRDMVLDDAVRSFLAGFRLPGEAQKIDRMMEKFAARYFEDNPQSFPSADTAFVLAFSVIMLNTDLHNPNIIPEKKMTKAGFLNNNRGIAGGRDLDPEFLGGIYDRIKTNEISLKEDDGERAKLEVRGKAGSGSGGGPGAGLFGSSREARTRRKRAAYSRERQEILESATSMLSSAKSRAVASAQPALAPKRKSFLKGRVAAAAPNGLDDDGASLGSSTTREEPVVAAEGAEVEADSDVLFDSNEHVEPMFEVTWAPFLAVFSVNLQRSDNLEIIDLLVDGMKGAIRIACRFGMVDKQRPLIDSLIKFTLLNSTQEMRPKHIRCIQGLLEVVQLEGDYLGSSWEPVLMCFSQLARMQLVSSGGDGIDDEYVDVAAERGALQRRKSHAGSLGGVQDNSIFSYFSSGPSPEELARMTDEANASRLLKKIDMILLDRIFLDSVNLTTTAITEMVDALCAVSRAELQITTSKANTVLGRSQIDTRPRIFALQKIVEVADSNMDIRPRFVWGRVWDILSSHFTAAGCHPDMKISMYAIDSLRQLTVKFLDKDELAGFHFQLQFMEPFEEMISKSSKSELRDLVLRCTENIILSRSKHLKSGWRVLLHVLSVGGNDKSPEIHALAFRILEHIVADHLEAIDAYFRELILCLFAFASNEANELELSQKAVSLMEKALQETLSNTTFEVTDEEAMARLWVLVQSFAILMGDRRPAVRERATDILFGQLQAHVEQISSEVWEAILRDVLLALFRNVRREVRPLSRETLVRLIKERASFEAQHGVAGDEKAASVGRVPQLSMPLPMSALVGGVSSGVGEQSALYAVLHRFVTVLEMFWDGTYQGSKFPDQHSGGEVVRIGQVVLEDLLQLLEHFVLSSADEISNIGVGLFATVLEKLGPRLNTAQWHIVASMFIHIMEDSTPMFLVDPATRLWLNLDAKTPTSPPTPFEGDAASTPRSAAAVIAASVGASDSLEEQGDTDVDEEVEEDEEDRQQQGEGEGRELGLEEEDDDDDDQEPQGAAPAPTQERGEPGLEAELQRQHSFSFPDPQEGDALPFSVPLAFMMCSVQLQMLKLIGVVVPEHLDRIGEKDLGNLLKMIKRSIDFARSFNDDLPLREELATRGFMHGDQSEAYTGRRRGSTASHVNSIPTLLRQETTALGRYLHLLFRANSASTTNKVTLSAGAQSDIEKRLEETLHSLFMHYLFQDRVLSAETERHERLASIEESEADIDFRFFTPVVSDGLHEILEWDITTMKKHIAWLYPLLTALLDCGNREVHAALRRIFDEQISKLLGLDVSKAE